MSDSMVRSIRVTVYYGDAPDGLSIDGFRAWLADRLAEIPEEFRGKERVDIEEENCFGDVYSRLCIEYWRPATDQEAAAKAIEYEQALHASLAEREAEVARLRAALDRTKA